MARSVIRCPDITIPAASTTSPWVDSRKVYDDAVAICLMQTGDTLDALTYTIEVTPDPDATVVLTATLQEAGVDVGPPALGKAKSFDVTPWRAFRIKASGATTNPATWRMTKEFFV